MHPFRFRRFYIALAAVALVLAPRLPAADTARSGLVETALDRYVAKADVSFTW